ncbi:hypothetical protein L6452_15945 [Arctium lappa]|uniref:Uncharacterized protein n=1 Tax=Arctium lappa TaxID=4217 RepID=A0ACB9CQ98_ARCLA|nr:hypothetical protein L6452_15945 [Arctium lappa]
MANTGLELLMENLKQIIFCDNNPLIKYNLFVQDKRPQLLFLYQELESLRTFVIDMEVAKEPNELEKVRNLERRLRDVVEEVEDIVDLFLTSAFIKNNTSMTMCGFDSMNRSLNFDRVMEEIRSVKEEIMEKKMQSQPEGLQPAAGTLVSRNLSSAVLKEEIIVGLDDALMVLVERLTGNHKKLDVISVVGMGGLVYGDQKDDAFPDFVLLDHLETLKVIQPEVQHVESLLSNKLICFPVSLKKLTLSGCRLPWSDMSKIQWLPNLEVLKLLNYAFEGPSWDTREGQFRQLKFLKLQNLDIQQWDAYSSNFPCLKRLVLLECYYLKGIPDEVGDIPTLEMIDIDKRNHSLVESANKIREEQHTMGNYELKVNVIGFLTSIR